MTSCSFRSFWRQASLPLPAVRRRLVARRCPGRARRNRPGHGQAGVRERGQVGERGALGRRCSQAAPSNHRQRHARLTLPSRPLRSRTGAPRGSLPSRYDRASELLRQGAKAPDVQKLLGPTSDALKSRIPRVTVELPADLSAPSATIDGKPYPSSELAQGVPLNPGRHTLRVAAAGRRPFEQVLMLQEAQPVTVQPRLSLAPPPVAPSSDPPRRLAVLPASPAPVPVPASAPVPAPARKNARFVCGTVSADR